MSDTAQLLNEAKAHQAAIGRNWYAEKDYEFGEISIREEDEDGQRRTGAYVEIASSSQMRGDDSTPEVDFIVWARNNLLAIIAALEVPREPS